MAVTIDAPPSGVWPWLVQMGCDRAGWYSWDRLDNGGTPSAARIHPEWQRVAVGHRWAAAQSGSAWFEVAVLEPEHFLALRAPLDLRGRPFDPAGPRPRFYSDSTWCFLLRELPGGRTRLVVSGYAAARPKLPLTVGNFCSGSPPIGSCRLASSQTSSAGPKMSQSGAATRRSRVRRRQWLPARRRA
jgi:hypothetical protein